MLFHCCLFCCRCGIVGVVVSSLFLVSWCCCGCRVVVVVVVLCCFIVVCVVVLLLCLLGHHATSRTTHRRQRLRRCRLAMSRHLLLARQCQTGQPKATESTTRPPRSSTYHSICSRKNCDHCSLVLSDCFNQT